MKPLSTECPNLTCIINQFWPGCDFFFTVLPDCTNQPRIDFLYHKYVPRPNCLLICGWPAADARGASELVNEGRSSLQVSRMSIPWMEKAPFQSVQERILRSRVCDFSNFSVRHQIYLQISAQPFTSQEKRLLFFLSTICGKTNIVIAFKLTMLRFSFPPLLCMYKNNTWKLFL